MQNFDDSRTKHNLARVFAGECQDGAKYQFLAKTAEEEGYAYLKSIFKTHAKNEMAHAKKFYDLLNDHSSTKQKNIEICAGYSFGSGSLLEMIEDTIGVETSQSDNVKNNKLYRNSTPIKWKCSNCGFEHTDKSAWDICPSCDMPQGYVEVQIDMNSGD